MQAVSSEGIVGSLSRQSSKVSEPVRPIGKQGRKLMVDLRGTPAGLGDLRSCEDAHSGASRTDSPTLNKDL